MKSPLIYHIGNATPSRRPAQYRISWLDWALRIAAGGAVLGAIWKGAL